ncbi:phosphatidylglycerol:prolipoprotein diacylglycerol transferase [Salirhabdus euzebyi]|uniref:Phosphatidylglycerol--prolipoprotein diacylglyceryl transferase n=1 Tax=Salirhabdus euzebyi TaxID=394506 RepID=A0A841Q5D4_9BACI|nr:prolipoprotein diacylglyceryl transferase [Salirhabdus euzebyi]MBB6453594.1 phosphatidylglycerol:prolipoprotein diacylglycerol transferase [Salirhabdus euzebyi]
MMCTTQPYSRVFLEIGNWPIYWYGVIIATGAFLGLLLATRESDRLGLKKDIFVDLLVFAIPAAIIFARIYYVIFEWDRYADGPWWGIFAIWEGGIAIHGALIGSVLTAWIYARVRKISFWQLADIAAPSLLLGQAIGRWGNFMNQEAYGGPVSEEAYNNFLRFVPDFIMNQMCVDGVMHHPTFLYESVWSFIGIAILLYLRKVNPRRGEIFFSYLIWYSIGRYFIEAMRTDSLYLFGTTIRVAMLISVLIIVGSVIAMFYRRKTGLADKHYNGKKVNKKKK